MPIVNTENGAQVSEVSHSASAAAIFIGCTSVMILPCTSPLNATPRKAITEIAAPSRMPRAYIWRSLLLRTASDSASSAGSRRTAASLARLPYRNPHTATRKTAAVM